MGIGPTTTPANLTVQENATAILIGISAPTDSSDLPLTVQITGLPGNGTVNVSGGDVVSLGQTMSATDLTLLEFTPASGTFDSSSELTYTVSDGEQTANGAATLNIGPAVGNPTAPSFDLYVPENSPSTALNILAPTDPNYDSSMLTVTIDSVPQTGSVFITGLDGGPLQSGAVISASDLAQLSFTPTTGLANQSDALTYTVTDPDQNSSHGTIAIVVGGLAGNPTVAATTLSVLENASATPIGIQAPTDPVYPQRTLTASITQLPTNGTVTLANGDPVNVNDQLSVAQLTNLQFTPNPDVSNVSDTLGYTVADPGDYSSSGTVTLSVGGPASDFSISSPSLDVAENSGLTPLGITAPTDVNYDPMQITITVDDLPTDGMVVRGSDLSPVATGDQLTADELTNLQFLPTPGEFDRGSAFTYTVSDPGGSATGTVVLGIGHAVGNPDAPSETLDIPFNTSGPLALPPLSDPNYDASQLTVTILGLPSNGTLYTQQGVDVSAGQTMSVADFIGLQFATGQLAFNQTSNLTYSVADPDGNTSTGTVTLSVGPATGAPNAPSTTIEVAENTALSLMLQAPTDTNFAASDLTISVLDVPENGTLTYSDGTPVMFGAIMSVGQFTTLQFAPAHGVFDQSASFHYLVIDPAGNASVGTVALSIGHAVGNPTAPSTTVNVANTGPTALDIAAPTDPNYPANQLTVEALTLPSNGVVTLADGTVIHADEQLTVDQLTGLQFTPATGVFNQSSTLTYAVTDPAANSSMGEVSFAIGPAVGDPVAPPASLTVAENSGATPIGIQAPSDPNYDASQLSITIGDLPSDGSVTLANGTAVQSGEMLTTDDLIGLNFAPTPGLFDQTSALTYTVTDPSGNQSSGNAQLVIGPAPNIDPVTGATLPTITPGGIGDFKVTDVPDTLAGTSDGTAYNGPVSYLQKQFIWNGSAAIAIKADTPSVFIKGGTAGDALQVTGGDNVLDGGGGSNFLVGADGSDGGSDVFFVDARGSAVTWSTIVNFHPGDQFTLWGFQAGTSTQNWDPWSGATGYEGVSMQSETNGPGTGINAAVTFAGITQQVADAQFTTDTGIIDGTQYMRITYHS